jgi:hypothetical protein
VTAETDGNFYAFDKEKKQEANCCAQVSSMSGEPGG